MFQKVSVTHQMMRRARVATGALLAALSAQSLAAAQGGEGVEAPSDASDAAAEHDGEAPSGSEGSSGAPSDAETPDDAELSSDAWAEGPVDDALFDDELIYEATAEIEAAPTGVTRHRLSGGSLRRIPGTRGDPIRAVEVMPGVSRSGGDPILRGAASDESRVYYDGVPVPSLYHLGGLTSAFQGHLIGRVDYEPGNFSARYGRVSGGIIALESRAPRSDRLHLMLDLSLLESAFSVESPLGGRTAVSLAARRSNLDFFFEQLVPEDAYSVVAAPVYWDYQAQVSHQIDRRHALYLSSYGSRDSFSLLFSEPDEKDPSLRGTLGGAAELHRVQLALSSEHSSSVTSRVQATYGRQRFEVQVGPLMSGFATHEVFSRGDLTWRASPSLELSLGTDTEYSALDGDYQGGRPPPNEGDPGVDEASRQLVEVVDTIHNTRFGAYLEATLRPVTPVSVTAGLRGDYYAHLRHATFDPRLSARFAVSERTTLKAGVGRYSQEPLYYYSVRGIGNPDIDPYYAIHVSLGVEQTFDVLSVSAEGFFKHLEDRVVATGGGQSPYFVNEGQGRVYGAELSARLAAGATQGYFAYTLSRSEREDRAEPTRLFDGDQTHVLSAALSQGLGRGWEVGARFRLTSGDPFTPVTRAVFDATTGQYVPVFGAVNSERYPTHHRLDLRVEKQWSIGQGTLAAYLDLLNAYAAQTREGTRYSYDYRKSEAVSGLPIFPSLGVRGEL